MLKRVLLVVWTLCMLWPLASLAGNGEGCNADQTQFANMSGGAMQALWCVSLVDDTTSGSGGPVSYDLRTGSTSSPNAKSLPDVMSFFVGTDNDCTAGSVTISTALVVGGESSLLSGSPTLDLSGVGTTRINVDLHQEPLGNIIQTEWSAVAGCAGGFDVLMVAYEYRR